MLSGEPVIHGEFLFLLCKISLGECGGGGGLSAAPFGRLGRPASPAKKRAALSGFTRTNSERVVLFQPTKEQKPSLQPFPLTLKSTNQNCGRLLSFFPYKMKITPTPKRLVAQRRHREGACCPKRHRQPSSRSKRDLLGRRSGDGASEEYPILNWVFREQRSPP